MTQEIFPMHDQSPAFLATDRAIKRIASRLDPIIAHRLAPHLGGMHWTQLLEERDRQNGKEGRISSATDPQSHFRIITERLGSLGYPFDDHRRLVSARGSELRVMRNRVSHNEPLDDVDAWRTADCGVQLLEQLGDHQGAEMLRELRDSIFRLARPEDVENKAGEDPAALTRPARPKAPDVVPEAEVLEAPATTSKISDVAQAQPVTALSGQRLTYEPWTLVTVGEKGILDNLRGRNNPNTGKVRAVIEEIVEAEGPIHMDRLAWLTCRAFDFGKVDRKRLTQAKHQASKAGITLVGDWAWPQAMDPNAWQGFRPNTSDADRKFEEIAPQEIRNAAAFLRSRHPEDSEEQLHRRVMQTFGRDRMTKGVRTHLVASLS